MPPVIESDVSRTDQSELMSHKLRAFLGGIRAIPARENTHPL